MSSSSSSSFSRCRHASSYSTCVWTLLFMLLVNMMTNTDTSTFFVEGYASWLRCYIELDPSEVVMHHFIVPAEKSRYPDIKIEVQEVVPSASASASASASWSNSNNEYIFSSNGSNTTPTSTRINARLVVPESLKNADIQYVMEIRDLEDDDDDDDDDYDDDDDDDDDEMVKFVGDAGSIMCNGQRAFGTEYGTYVTIEIPSSINYVELVAGFARGMTEVTLTPIMKLKRDGTSATASSSSTTTADSPNGEL